MGFMERLLLIRGQVDKKRTASPNMRQQPATYGGPTPPARTRQIRAWWSVVTGLSGLWQLADTNQRQPAATARHAQPPQ